MPVVAASPPPPPAPAPAPAGPPTLPADGSIPPELVNATSFRHIMVYLLNKEGLRDHAAIVARCEALRPYVGAIGRLAGDLNERVARALEVLLAEKNVSGAPAAS